MKIFDYKSQFGWPGDNGLGLQLIEQIKRGEKTATAGPKALYSENELKELYANVGKPATVIDKDGTPHCNIMLVEVFETNFGNPDERAIICEGFENAEAFKNAHMLAWKDLIDSGELKVNDDTVLVVELFEFLKNLKFSFDIDLREVLESPADVEAHVKSLLSSIETVENSRAKATMLGEAGVFLRMLLRLDSAQRCVEEAIRVLPGGNVPLMTANMIRLAHIYQWQRKFEKSDAIFSELIKAQSDVEDFIWQHAGKNYFDQRRYSEALNAFEKALAIRLLKSGTENLVASTRFAIEQTLLRMQS